MPPGRPQRLAYSELLATHRVPPTGTINRRFCVSLWCALARSSVGRATCICNSSTQATLPWRARVWVNPRHCPRHGSPTIPASPILICFNLNLLLLLLTVQQASGFVDRASQRVWGVGAGGMVKLTRSQAFAALELNVSPTNSHGRSYRDGGNRQEGHSLASGDTSTGCQRVQHHSLLMHTRLFGETTDRVRTIHRKRRVKAKFAWPTSALHSNGG